MQHAYLMIFQLRFRNKFKMVTQICHVAIDQLKAAWFDSDSVRAVLHTSRQTQSTFFAQIFANVIAPLEDSCLYSQ